MEVIASTMSKPQLVADGLARYVSMHSTDIGVNSKLFWNRNDISGLRKLRLICIETVDREKFDEEA